MIGFPAQPISPSPIHLMFTRPSSTSLSIFNFQIVHHQPPFPNAKPHPDLRVFHHHKAVQKCSLNHLLLSRSSIFILLSFSERTPVAFSLLNFKASFRTVALGIVTLYFTFFEKESAYYWVDKKQKCQRTLLSATQRRRS